MSAAANATTDGVDPTRTTTLRRRYEGEMYRRFRELRGIVRTATVERDVFGLTAPDRSPEAIFRRDVLDRLSTNPLGPPGDPERFPDFDACVDALTDPPETTRAEAEAICGSWEARTNRRFATAQFGRNPVPGDRAFAGPSDAETVASFREWLGGLIDRGLLDPTPDPSMTGTATASGWQNPYLRDAYVRGVKRATHETNRMGANAHDPSPADILGTPRHGDALSVIRSRAYNELDGVTSAMDQSMTRVLSDGLQRGAGPREIARDLNETVRDIGERRGRLIARTEVNRAFNEGALSRYEELGVGEVDAAVEFATAGDLRVCPECAFLEGQTFSIDGARGLLPVHPNCRCTWLPAPAG